MNNFTRTAEALPKTGHVNEVCKEWLVREDSALAYKLQSQEITDFYKGNRQRNAVVREDFPTALNEQIKEHENAEKQAEVYRRRLQEQEQHDKRVAKEIADNLERDLQEQRQRELQESEEIAQQMQELYVNMPPPVREKSRQAPPPRPAKASILQQNSTEPSTSNGRYYNHHQAATQHQHQHPHQHQHKHQHHHQHQHQSSLPSSAQTPQYQLSTQQQAQQSLPLSLQHLNNTDCYVGLSVHKSTTAATSPTAASTAAPVATSAARASTGASARQKTTQAHHAPSANAGSNTKNNNNNSHKNNNTSHLLVSADAANVLSTPTNQFVERSKVGRTPHALTTDNLMANNQSQQHFAFHQQQHQHQHQHSLSSISTGSASSTSTNAAVLNSSPNNITHHPSSPARRSNNTHESFALNTSPHSTIPQTPQSHSPAPASALTSTSIFHPITSTNTSSAHAVEELIDYSDVADSIRRYDMGGDSDAPDSPQHQQHSLLHTGELSSASNNKINRYRSPSHENLLRNEQKFQKLSPEKYDQLVGNDMLRGAGAERHMQAHADDIELYVDPCDYASLKEIGLPMDEIKEMSKKLKQEQKDELLARRLQEMESNDGLTQEERDRLLAIEAQDKELAKMLQERERAKAKRAKEKARLRKSQQKDTNCASSNSTLCTNGNNLHCGPLLPLPQDCLSFGKHSNSHTTSTTASSAALHEDIIDVEAYSNPIDVLHSQQQQQQQQRQPNGTLTNGSLTRDATQRGAAINGNGNGDIQRDDDIYTLPVDSCRPGQRPVSLNINNADNTHLLQHNSMTRSEYSMDAHDTLNSRLNYSKSGTFVESSSPTPPYMPIQGTRRSNSSEDRKKKSKDKCTHQ